MFEGMEPQDSAARQIFHTHARIRASGWNPRNPKELREYFRIQLMTDAQIAKELVLLERKWPFNTP
jgi:hypothetical protein